MQARHITEKLGVEEAHTLEVQQFNKIWDKKTLEQKRNTEGLVNNHIALSRGFVFANTNMLIRVNN